jgi:hypothetical protein
MDTPSHSLSQELTNTVVSLQSTVHDVRLKIDKDQQNIIVDLTQPVRPFHTLYNPLT